MAVVSHLGHTSGQYITSAIPLTPGMSLQAMAGEATYARRISMAGLLGLAADWDDDGTQSKANHARHKYVSEADKKWSEKAEKALADATSENDEDRIIAIKGLMDQAVRDGKMSQASKEMLLAKFNLDKETPSVK